MFLKPALRVSASSLGSTPISCSSGLMPKYLSNFLSNLKIHSYRKSEWKLMGSSGSSKSSLSSMS